MRNTLYPTILLIFSLFITTSYAQKSTGEKFFEPYTENAEIEITLKGAPEGTAYLFGVYGDQNLLKDSAQADSTGKVVFKSAQRYPEGLYYVIYKDRFSLTFLLDRNQKIFLHTDKADVNHRMETNSADNKVYYMSRGYEGDVASKQNRITKDMEKTAPGSKEYDALNSELIKLIDEKAAVIKEYQEKYPGSFFVTFKIAGQNPKMQYPKKRNGDLDTLAQLALMRKEFWNNYDFNDVRLLRTPVYANKLAKYLNTLFYQQVDSLMEGVKFILAHTDKGNKEIFNFTVNYLLLTYEKPHVMGGEKIFCYTVDNYFTYEKAYWTDSVNVYRAKQKSNLMKPSLLGETGQDLNCKNEQGEYVSLYSIKKPIRVVWLYNPDCEHCQKETPKLKALYDKWKSKGLEVYALNIESEYDKWHNFIKELQLDWVNVIDPKIESRYDRKYFFIDTPGIFVLDANNKIVAKQLMPDNLEYIFESMLEKKN
jgi:thiol-disulfide isomerase/thioredoxin